MPRIKVPGFIGGAYTLRSVNVDAQRCVNLIPEQDETGQAKDEERMSLRHRPGMKLFARLGDGSIRGMWTTSAGRVFAACGNTFCEVLSDGSGLNYAYLSTDRGTVSMADNGKQLLMVDGDRGFLLDLTTSIFSQITSGGFPAQPEFAAFIDGYFLVNNAQSRDISFSGLYDGASWDGLDIFSKEAQPDNLRAMLPASGSLYCVGDYSYEVFYDTGDTLNPFQRIPGAFGEVGIAAPQTLKVVDRAPFFVGKEKSGQNMVFRFNGYRPARISTYAVEQALDGYGDISKGTAWGYQFDGHTYYCINLPNAKSTWVYDVATQLWHEETWTDSDGQQHRHRAEHHAYAFGKHLVGDYQNGNIYELRDDLYADHHATMTRVRTFPHISDQQKTIFHRRLEIYAETGVGNPGASDSTAIPVAISSVSRTLGTINGDTSAAIVTVTTSSPHGFSNTQRTLIDGVTDATFNGIFPIYSVTSSTFVYYQINADALIATSSSGGTATALA